MRWLVLLILAFSFQLSASAKNQVANGNLSYGQEIFDTLQINGSVTLSGTMVLQKLQVNGSLNATNAQIGELQINGQASLSHCVVKNKCDVTGSLKASFSNFEQAIVLTSDNSSFDSCAITSIQVPKTRDHVTQTIEIKGKTTLTGLISFESGNGQVIACRDCSIKEAQVVGGKLIKR
jgi:hypothetical protein